MQRVSLVYLPDLPRPKALAPVEADNYSRPAYVASIQNY